MMKMTDHKRIDAFQGFRGYAIILIFFSHCNFSTNSYGMNSTIWLGGLGVSLFIMLSGYLVAYNTGDSNQIIPIKTIKKRLIRFYPLHLITFLIALPFSIKAFIRESILYSLFRLGLNIFLIHSWIPSSSIYFSFNAVSWYLSLTLFFLMMSSLTKKFLKKFSVSLLPVVLIIIFLFELVLCYLVKDISFAHWLVYICPAIRYFDYFAGGALCEYVRTHKNKISKISFPIFNVSVISMLIIFIISVDSNSEFFSTAFWFMPSAMMIMAVSSGEKRIELIDKVFSNKIIIFIGDISFEFFLFHQLVLRYLSYVIGHFPIYSLGQKILIPILSFAVTIILSFVWHKYFNLDKVREIICQKKRKVAN